jgi:hypothetical protein
MAERRRIFNEMRMLFAVAVATAAATSTACGGGPAGEARDCFGAWNAKSNHSRQALVAGRFTTAEVSPWLAEAEGTGNVGGPPSHGCGYLFHTSRRYLSISGAWRDHALRWGVPPTIRGTWSTRQQASVHDNATVDGGGLLSSR